jgi:hypothetical protein
MPLTLRFTGLSSPAYADPTGAGLIDRHDLLAQNSAKPIHHHPERDVYRAPGRGIGNDSDGLARIILRLCWPCIYTQKTGLTAPK